MPKRFAALCAFLLLSLSLSLASTRGELPSGPFEVLNTAGFVQQDGVRKPLEDTGTGGTANIVFDTGNVLTLDINGSQIRLFPVENGLAALQWNAEGTALLHDIDIQDLNDDATPEDIPAWGAEIAWPGTGAAQMVLLPLSPGGYTGFLISHPEGKKVVRQMEFLQVFGPAHRP